MNTTDSNAQRPIIRLNISLPGEVDEMLAIRAKAERRSKSAHVAWLIEADVARTKSESESA